MTKNLRINASHLQVGMSVLELDRPWIETPFLLHGFTISSRIDISTIQEYCEYVYIDANSMPVPLQIDRIEDAHINKPEVAKRFFKKPLNIISTSVEKEISTAKAIHSKASSLVKTCMDDILLGNAVNEEAIKKNVSDTVESIVRNPDAMMWLTRLDSKNNRTAQHSINCSILAVSFGRAVGMPKDELIKLAISALMHDIGVLQIPTEIMNKPGTLTAKEMDIIQRHPTTSRNLLMSAGNYFLPAVDVAYTHHERIDGSGYPRGLNDSQISPFAKMLAILDTYESMTNEQVYREEFSPFETLKYINANKGIKYDEQLVKQFIWLIGVFPVGSIVELTSGQIGIVITSNREDNLRPKILIMLDQNKLPTKNTILNLTRNNVDALGRVIKIARTLRKGDYGIDQQQLIAEGVQFTVLN